MNGIDSVTAAGGSSDTTAAAQAQVAQLGLPPASLAQAASANTVNAELVTAAWGVDPAAVSGVSGTDSSSGLFAGASLLPLLSNLSHANAEQALSLLGVQAPTSAASGSQTAGQAAAASAAADAPGSSGSYLVDPLWGKQA